MGLLPFPCWGGDGGRLNDIPFDTTYLDYLLLDSEVDTEVSSLPYRAYMYMYISTVHRDSPILTSHYGPPPPPNNGVKKHAKLLPHHRVRSDCTPLATKTTLNNSHSQTSSSSLHCGHGLGWTGPGCGHNLQEWAPNFSRAPTLFETIPRFPVLWAPIPESVTNLRPGWLLVVSAHNCHGAHGPPGDPPPTSLTFTSSLAAPAPPSSNQNPPARHGVGRPWRPCGVAICNPSYRQKETHSIALPPPRQRERRSRS